MSVFSPSIGLLMILALSGVVAGLAVFFSRRRRRTAATLALIALIGGVFLVALLPARRVAGPDAVVVVTPPVTAGAAAGGGRASVHVDVSRESPAPSTTDRSADSRQSNSPRSLDSTGNRTAAASARDAQSAPAQSRSRSVNWLASLLSLAGIGLLTTFVYLFLDAGRRPRYTWLIRAGSVAAFAVTCLVLSSIGPH